MSDFFQPSVLFLTLKLSVLGKFLAAAQETALTLALVSPIAVPVALRR